MAVNNKRFIALILLFIFGFTITGGYSGAELISVTPYNLHVGNYANYTMYAFMQRIYIPDPDHPGKYMFVGYEQGIWNRSTDISGYFTWRIVGAEDKYYVVKYFVRVYVDKEVINHPEFFGIENITPKDHYDFSAVVRVNKKTNIVQGIGKSNIFIIPERDYNPELVENLNMSVQNNTRCPIILENFFGYTIRGRVFLKSQYPGVGGTIYPEVIHTGIGDIKDYYVFSPTPPMKEYTGYLNEKIQHDKNATIPVTNYAHGSYMHVEAPDTHIIYDRKSGILVSGLYIDDVLVNKFHLYEPIHIVLHDANLEGYNQTVNYTIYYILSGIFIIAGGTGGYLLWKKGKK